MLIRVYNFLAAGREKYGIIAGMQNGGGRAEIR